MNHLFIYTSAFLPHLLSLLAIGWALLSWRSKTGTWLLHVFSAILLFSVAYFSGIWAFTSIYFKYLYVALAGAAIVVSYFLQHARQQKTQQDPGTVKTPRMILFATVILGLGTLNFLVVKGYHYPGENAIEMQFPMKNGDYYILQGGNSPVTNIFQ